MYNGQDVSVIIPTYYRHDIINNVLSALSRQSVQPLEVLVVDQTPVDDRPAEFYEQFSSLPLRVINLDKPSLSHSKNFAANSSKTELLLFLDDDVLIGDDLIENHLDVMNQERVDVVSGAVSEHATLPEEFKRVKKRMDPLSFFLKSPNKQWNGMTLVQNGPNACIRKEVFLAVGGYDENIPRMEDIELGYRLFQYGAKMFYSVKPFVQFIRHPTGGTRKTQKNLEYVKLWSKFYLYKKHFPGWTTRQFVIREIINALLFKEPVSGKFRKISIVKPLKPFFGLWNLFRANREIAICLKNIQEPEYKKFIS